MTESEASTVCSLAKQAAEKRWEEDDMSNADAINWFVRQLGANRIPRVGWKGDLSTLSKEMDRWASKYDWSWIIDIVSNHMDSYQW